MQRSSCRWQTGWSLRQWVATIQAPVEPTSLCTSPCHRPSHTVNVCALMKLDETQNRYPECESGWGDRFEFWQAGSYRRRNHLCQIFLSIGYGVLEFRPPPWNFTICIVLADRPYNSVCTAELHCDFICILSCSPRLYHLMIVCLSPFISVTSFFQCV